MCSIEIFSEVDMTFVSRKTRLLLPHIVDECDPRYLYHLHRKRSDGRLKRYSSCDDLRAWVDDEYLNYQYLLELMTDGEFQERPFLGLIGRFIPVDVILDILCGKASNIEDTHTGWISEREDASVQQGTKGKNIGKQESKGRDTYARDGNKSGYTSAKEESNVKDIYEERGNEEDTFAELGDKGPWLSKQKPKPTGTDLYNSTVNKATENLLKLAKAAMTKLETIRGIVGLESCNQVGKGDMAGSEKGLVAEKERVRCSSVTAANSTDMDENEVEYRSTLAKIVCLKQRLHSIKECREELNAKVQSSRQTMCQPSSGMGVTELYNREEQSNMKRLQKKIEKLIAEKGQVLEEMCRSLKYLNELKKNDSSGRKQNCGCQFAYPRAEGNYDSEDITQVEDTAISHGEGEWTDLLSSTPKANKLGREHHQEMCRNCTQYPLSETQSAIRNSSRGSSEMTFKSTETVPISNSPPTYKMSPIPDKKFKSETSMTEVEQTLRSFEQRLRELSCLESEVEDLKKKAGTAEYFKKRWIRSVVKGRTQKTAVEDMKREIQELYQENCHLKQVVQKFTAESEKKQIEMQRLRCKAMKLCCMKQEVIKLKSEINDYQLSCQSQNECIGRLENTIREQRDEIDRLMTHMTRLYRVTEKLREVKKPVKKNFPRSRSYGPDRQNGTRSSTATEKDMECIPCCCCIRRNCSTDTLNRHRSECGRRMPDRCCESLSQQETCRD